MKTKCLECSSCCYFNSPDAVKCECCGNLLRWIDSTIRTRLAHNDMTRPQICDWLGFSRDHVCKAIKRLRVAGLVFIAGWEPPPSTTGKGNNVARYRAGSYDDVPQPLKPQAVRKRMRIARELRIAARLSMW